jgi:hypothetical protein
MSTLTAEPEAHHDSKRKNKKKKKMLLRLFSFFFFFLDKKWWIREGVGRYQMSLNQRGASEIVSRYAQEQGLQKTLEHRGTDIDYRCEEGRFPFSAGCTIPNLYFLSTSEQGIIIE